LLFPLFHLLGNNSVVALSKRRAEKKVEKRRKEELLVAELFSLDACIFGAAMIQLRRETGELVYRQKPG